MAAQWYIVQAHSGFEKKVAQSIKDSAAKKGITEMFEEVVVPTEEVVEMRRGKKATAERKFYPGYVLVKMQLNDASWHLVKTTPKVAGFLGGGNTPQPMPQSEVDRIFKQMEEGVGSVKSGIIYEIGESVKVTDGPFESFTGVVEGVDEEKERLRVSVSIFGRATPVELAYSQVQKAS